ncbi:TlpA family protein disulfide reductase [Hymenobacter sp. B81]|uniref:TlpA family protein disulfide reductase n=1 Tax=Hymenobacter sp. B81 TaxID=3344878 RepID=UPI0037DC273F
MPLRSILLFIWLLGSLPALAQRPAATATSGYEVRGQLGYAPAGTRVQVAEYQRGRPLVRDSTQTDAAGRFRLRGQLAGPRVYVLRLPGLGTEVGLALAPGSRLQVRGDARRLWATVEVTGTAEATALAAMNREHARVMGRLQELAPRRAQATNSAAQRRLEQEWGANMADFAAAAKRLARQDSYLAPYVTATFLSGVGSDEALADSVTEYAARRWPALPYTQQLLRYQAARRATAVGQPAPEVQLPGPDGQLQLLSSLRGQYVVLDFWASWCGPCRTENAHLVQLRQQYRAKGFEVFSVSVDENKEAWTTAIRQDGLQWVQVLDAAGENSVAANRYNVYQYPTSFLLDRQGRIIAKDLRGKALDDKLAELMP